MLDEMQLHVVLLIGLLAVLLYNRDRLTIFLTIFGYGSAVVFGLLLGAGTCLFTGKKHKTVIKDDVNSKNVLRTLLEAQNMKYSRTNETQSTYFGQKRQQTTFTRNIDGAIDEFINLTIKDFIFSWLKPLVSDAESITDELREDIWISLANLKERLTKIDEQKFITHDIPECLCQHYQRIRQASNSLNSKEKKATILLRPYLTSKERELEFLRKVSELLIVQLAPKSYVQSIPLRHLIREIISCTVLYPAINQLCDPDFINLKLLGYLQQHQETLDQHRTSYTYAATYESFIKMIQECEDADQMKHILSNIMIEIMQATTINNLKKSKGVDVEKEFISQRNAKGDLLQARNLKRYINQLNFAKAACEKQIKLLGDTPCHLSTTDSSPGTSKPDGQFCAHEKVLPYAKLIESDFARCFFFKFLLKEDSRFLLEFYEAVEELKDCVKTKQHELGSEIYQTYIPQISNLIKLDRSTLKGMESFLLGNKGPEAFIQAQELVYKFVEDRYYPCFIVSDTYRQMLLIAKQVGVDFETDINYAETADELNNEVEEPITSNNSRSPNIPFAEQHELAKNKLEQLNERFSNKIHALKAMQQLSMTEPKLQVTNILEKEIEEMISEKKILTSHIENTDLWIENLGKWTVDVHSVEMVEEKDKIIPHYLLVVQLEQSYDILDEDEDEDNEEENEEDLTKTKGWLVKRKLSDFIELSQKLSQLAPWVKTIELPKESKTKCKGNEKTNLDSAIDILNNFMDRVLTDDKLNMSESLYAFLIPSPDYLKQSVPGPKKSKFFLANLFKSSNRSNSQDDGSDDDELLFFDDIDSSSKDDRIAEPLYSLIGEIFDMRGVSMLLRRTLITFVQITFGRTISRQIRDTVQWMVSETMVVFYINLLKESIWNGENLTLQKPARSDEQKLETRIQAQQQLLTSIPEVFSNLFGQQSTKKGTQKIFESLQDLRLNKQLFYELLELLIIVIFPEFKATEKL